MCVLYIVNKSLNTLTDRGEAPPARLGGIFDAVMQPQAMRLCGALRGYAASSMRLEGIFDAAEGLGIIIGLSHAAQAAA